jgi:hypothetical protein
MNAKEIKELESYFKTENEHWNGYAFSMLNEVIKQRNFENPETPLLLFSKAIDIFTEQYETPIKAVQNFSKETDKQKLALTQKLFVYEKVLDYVKYSEFEKSDIDDIRSLLKSQIESLKVEVKKQEPEYNKPLVGSIRDILKEQIQKELKQLPDTLKDLEPVQRLNILCKLIPYVLPKVEAVHSEKGEPTTENKTSISGFQWD